MGDCKILYRPADAALLARGASPIAYSGAGEKKSYFAKQDEEGNWIYEVPQDVASFVLTQEPAKFFLVEPAELTVNRGSLLSGYIAEVVKAVKLGKPAPKAAGKGKAAEKPVAPVLAPKEEEKVPEEAPAAPPAPDEFADL